LWALLEEANSLIGQVAAHLGRVGQCPRLLLLEFENPKLGPGRGDGQLQVLGILKHRLGVLPGHEGGCLGQLRLFEHRPRRAHRFVPHASLYPSQVCFSQRYFGPGHFDLR
jgi:hypothetical protein